jgi:hypothetical protein
MTVPGNRFELDGASLEAWCNRQGYTYKAVDGQLIVEYAVLGLPAPLIVLPQIDRGMVMLVMRQPYAVPAARFVAVTQAANTLNASSFMGAWVLNDEKAELYFRVTVVALDTQYTDESLLHAARVVVGTSEVAAPVLRAIALDGAEPGATIAAFQQGR